MGLCRDDVAGRQAAKQNKRSVIMRPHAEGMRLTTGPGECCTQRPATAEKTLIAVVEKGGGHQGRLGCVRPSDVRQPSRCCTPRASLSRAQQAQPLNFPRSLRGCAARLIPARRATQRPLACLWMRRDVRSTQRARKGAWLVSGSGRGTPFPSRRAQVRKGGSSGRRDWAEA